MPYTKDRARAAVRKLVEDFKAKEELLRNQQEAQLENDFIRPLFEYLNWNVSNRGLAVAQYEFIVQRADHRGKKPDYVLQLDGRPLLVADAKSLRHDIHESRWMNQVYAYAYSTQSLSPARNEISRRQVSQPDLTKRRNGLY